jgi:hypothetical protein
MKSFLLAIVLAGSVTPAAAKERVDLSRYSIEVPAGWMSQVEDERWMMQPAGAVGYPHAPQ